jgi:ubiquinone/menaquinone biosynthesis C-methylase UbiE
MKNNQMSLNHKVRDYWEQEPCGTHSFIVKDNSKFSIDYFESIESYRYSVEPFIHSIAQFTTARGLKVLEIGVGAGTDHLQWGRAGAILYGVDLTDAAIETVKKRFDMFGIHSNLQRVDAESLPFDDNFFDIVYSWGVIHHSEKPESIIAEIHRVLKPGGKFVGMFYHRRSLKTFRVWVRNAFLKGRPWLSFSHVLFHHVESIGTKAYSRRELHGIFSQFERIIITPFLTVSDSGRLPKWLVSLIPQMFGWYYGISVKKRQKA